MDEPARSRLPMLETVHDMGVVSIRHRVGSSTAAQAVRDAGWPWPQGCQPVRMPEGWLMRTSPSHCLVLHRRRRLQCAATLALAPGKHPEVMAIDVSEGTAVLALHGAGTPGVMARVMDGEAPGWGTDRVDTARVAGLQVTMQRWQDGSIWLLVERTLAEHLAGHLRQAVLDAAA